MDQIKHYREKFVTSNGDLMNDVVLSRYSCRIYLFIDDTEEAYFKDMEAYFNGKKYFFIVSINGLNFKAESFSGLRGSLLTSGVTLHT